MGRRNKMKRAGTAARIGVQIFALALKGNQTESYEQHRRIRDHLERESEHTWPRIKATMLRRREAKRG